eukprot:g10835.t1
MTCGVPVATDSITGAPMIIEFAKVQSPAAQEATQTARNSRNSSVSDLLINFRGDFADWLPAIQKKALETLEKKCEREVLGAQKRVREAAETGAGLFVISQEVFDSAPRSTCGHPIHLAYVAQYFSHRLGYEIHFGPDRVEYDFEEVITAAILEVPDVAFPYPTTSAAYLPLRITLHAKDETSVDLVRLRGVVESILGRTNTVARGSTSSKALGAAQTAFVNSVNAGVKAGVDYVLKLALDEFKAGNPRMLLTEELWKAAPKLPNGKLPPLWPNQRHEAAGGSVTVAECMHCVFNGVRTSSAGVLMGNTSARADRAPFTLPVFLRLM